MRVLAPLQVFPQEVERGEGDWRTNEKHRLPLQTREDDLVHGPDAVNIRRDEGDREIARVHHPQIDVEGFPEFLRAMRPLFVPGLALFESPFLPDVDRVDVLQAVLRRAAHAWFEPGVENNRALRAQEIADPVAPAELFFICPRGDEIHRAGKVNARPAQEMVLVHRASIEWRRREMKRGFESD